MPADIADCYGTVSCLEKGRRMTDHPHLERVPVGDRLPIWRAAIEELGEAGAAVRVELADVARDPTRHMLERAAKAARHAERCTSGRANAVANALAVELETMASVPVTSRA